MFGYADATGRISSATRGARADTFAYDGSLPTTAGEYTYGYADDTQLESIQLAGTAKPASATTTMDSSRATGRSRGSGKRRSATSARSPTTRSRWR